MAGLGVVAQLVGFVAQKILPQPNADNSSAIQNLRVGTYGELAINGYLTKKHALAGEGSAFVTATTPGAASVLFPIVTSYANTAGCLFFQNANAVGGPVAYLDYLKLTCYQVPASTTQVGYAIIRELITNLAITTNHVTSVAPVNTNGVSNVASKCNVLYQNSATASVNGAPAVATGAVIGSGRLGGLPIIGDELVIDFGGDASSAYGATSVASRKVSTAPAIAVPPGQQIMIVPWFVGNSATGGTWYMELVHFEL